MKDMKVWVDEEWVRTLEPAKLAIATLSSKGKVIAAYS